MRWLGNDQGEQAALPVEVQLVERGPNAVQPVYADASTRLNFVTLQQNLQNCLSIIDTEVMKDYLPTLRRCEILPFDEHMDDSLQTIQFFRITELVYQEDEFSVHKLATVFHTLSNRPCTLVLMIQSDGQSCNFYLGVRPRDSANSAGTMRKLLERSLLGLFPGSRTAEYHTEELESDLRRLGFYPSGSNTDAAGCVASVSCIADYKQDKTSANNKDFFQGLDKFINSMHGTPFTSIFLANNLEHEELVATRKDYEKVYTLISPFANMQYNYTNSNSSSSSDSDTKGEAQTASSGATLGVSTTQNSSVSETAGSSLTHSTTDTLGTSESVSAGTSHTQGTSDGTSDSETETKSRTIGASANVGVRFNGLEIAGKGIEPSAGVGAFTSYGTSHGTTHGISHTDSVSDTISNTLTHGMNRSQSVGESVGETESLTRSNSVGSGAQFSQNIGESYSSNFAHTKALTDTFGTSQATTLNVQNKALLNTLARLDKLLERLDECESIGMWDFAAYFVGESAAEAETAANMYQSLISGQQSGLQISAVNSWTDLEQVHEILKYLRNFHHPVFLHQLSEAGIQRQSMVRPTVLASTNELAIQLGLPRSSVKGLPVIEHASFAQEVLTEQAQKPESSITLGVVNHLGRDTNTEVCLDLQGFSMHTFITGSTGSGKSNTIYELLRQFSKNGVSYMVIEPAKGEYKNIFGHENNVSVFGTNPAYTELLQINPFKFPSGIHVLEHIDRLVEIFNVCWPMYAAMPAVLKDAVLAAYSACGWDLTSSQNAISAQLFPTFQDLLEQLVRVINESGYSDEVKSNYIGSLTTRVRSLTNGLNGQIFSSNEIDNHILFDKNVIVDISRVGSSETKSLLMGILIMRLSEYRMCSGDGMNAPLRHITVLEEAHNILKRTSTEQSMDSGNMAGKSVEMLSNAIAEMRTYGEGFIIADQSPSTVDLSAIRNTNTKIIMRLPDEADRRLAGKAAALKDEQLDEIAKLTKGVAAVYQNDWLEPVLCKISRYPGEEVPYTLASDAGRNQRFQCNVHWFYEELLNFLLRSRLPSIPEIDIARLLRELPYAPLSTNHKLGVIRMIKEYRVTGKLAIWEDAQFAALANAVVEVLDCKTNIEHLILTSISFEELTRAFMELLHTKGFSFSKELSLAVEQCFMKDFSINHPEGSEIYAAWRKNFQ